MFSISKHVGLILNFLTFFSWSWQWCRKRCQITNLFWTTFLSINIQRDLNFGTFYYIIDNFSCCSKFKCWQETISPPHFDPQERYTARTILNDKMSQKRIHTAQNLHNTTYSRSQDGCFWRTPCRLCICIPPYLVPTIIHRDQSNF